MSMPDDLPSALDWGTVTQVGSPGIVAGMALLWFAILGIGPLRVLGVAAQGNIAVVSFRYLPGRLRREKWEIWLALPLFAYLASVSSGLVTGLYLSNNIFAHIVAAALFGSTLIAIILIGVFLGLQDRQQGLEDVTDPGAFRADLVEIDRAGNVTPETMHKARSQLGRLNLEGASPWLIKFEGELKALYAITSQPGPVRGLGAWRDAKGQRIAVKSRYVAKRAIERKDLLCGPVVGSLFAGVLVVTLFQNGLHRAVEWLAAYLAAALAIAIFSFCLTYIAARRHHIQDSFSVSRGRA